MKGNEKPKNAKTQAIEVVDSPDIKRIYSNYLSVTTGPHECSLTFCHIDPLNVSPSKIRAAVVAKVMIPNSLVEEAVATINKNFQNAIKRMKTKEAQAKKSTPKK